MKRKQIFYLTKEQLNVTKAKRVHMCERLCDSHNFKCHTRNVKCWCVLLD